MTLNGTLDKYGDVIYTYDILGRVKTKTVGDVVTTYDYLDDKLYKLTQGDKTLYFINDKKEEHIKVL